MAASGVMVTAEQCRNWDKNGKNDFVRHCKSLVSSDREALLMPNLNNSSKDIKRAIYDLCSHVIKGSLRVDQAFTALHDIQTISCDMPSLFADILTILDVETVCKDDRAQREKFTHLLNSFQSLIPEQIIKERIDVDTLEDVGFLKNKKLFYTKFIKTKTKLFYKQHKFNLFREESEGYSKLITELNQEFTGSINSAYLLQVIKSLIGCFNLDPNRVLDVILEAFECRSHLYPLFIPLIRSYMCDQNTLCEVLGFKFNFYQSTLDVETPKSLHMVVALMLQHELISLDNIYPHLRPKDNDMLEESKQFLLEARTYARKLNAVATTGDKPAEAKDEEKENHIDRNRNNQKLGLCEALLNIGDWTHAQMIIQRLPDYYATSHPAISNALCQLLNAIIEPVYRSQSGLGKLIKSKTKAIIGDQKFAPNPVETFAELRTAFFPMLCVLGPQLHRDPILMVKVIRLGKAYFSQKTSADGVHGNLEYDFLTVLDEALLPSLSLLDCNCCMAEELWSLLKLYPYQNRYRLYSQWKNESYVNHPLLIKTKADFLKKIKYIMKRLSKENVKPSGRHIGKLSHSNPGFLFEYILSQIQTWDNLITPVVDSLKYLTNLSYDILAYCIIEALANPEKVRMKHDGTSISLWLQSLSSFCGAVFKKYPVELTGLLQYVANQLKAEKSLDLLILKEIVQKMAGIEALEDMTSDQLEAMAGGELLRAEGGYFSQIRNTKKSSQRLKDALLEQDLAVPLCLLMAQQRNCIIYKEEESSHLKLVGKLYDQCQDALVQYGSFLATNLSMDDYVRRLPPINELMADYRITSDVAFFLSRPMFQHAINSKFDEVRRQDKSYRSASDQEKINKYVDIVEAMLSPVVEAVRPLQPGKVWEDISCQFYVTFWSLAMYDLYVPSTSYEREISKLKSQIAQIEENKDMVQSKKKKEVDRCKTLKDKLQEEEKRQKDHCDRVLARLQMEKDNWFLSRSAKNETITQFLQLCVFPRCILTAMDAVYCARFVHTIHNLKTPNFSTLICYDRIFCDITYTVTSCTENEANRYGRFLCSMLETVMRWHSDKSIFEKECANYPGFVTRFRIANQPPESASDHVDYQNYRHVCHKWHYKITKALVICLESKDYVQIRNSLIVLIKVLPFYPMITNLGQVIEKRIEKVRTDEKEKRPDLYALALGYLGQLKSKKSSMIPEQEFHVKEVKAQPVNNGPKVEVKSTPKTSLTIVNTHSAPMTVAQAASLAASAALANSANSDLKLEKSRENITLKDKERKPTAVVKNDQKSDVKQGVTIRVSADSAAKSSATSGSAAVTYVSSMSRKENSSSKMSVPRDLDRDDVRSRQKEDKIAKDDRFQDERTSHGHREDIMKDKKMERTPVLASASGGSHGYRRGGSIPPESDRDLKRRKVEAPSTSTKSPHHDEKERDRSKDRSSLSKSSGDSVNAMVSNVAPSPSVSSNTSAQATVASEHKFKEKNRESGRSKERDKSERKRDRSDDKNGASPAETKRRKDEESGKVAGRQNGESDVRDKEKHKREESAERKTRSREQRGDSREDKKHHRVLSSSNSSSKKR